MPVGVIFAGTKDNSLPEQQQKSCHFELAVDEIALLFFYTYKTCHFAFSASQSRTSRDSHTFRELERPGIAADGNILIFHVYNFSCNLKYIAHDF